MVGCQILERHRFHLYERAACSCNHQIASSILFVERESFLKQVPRFVDMVLLKFVFKGLVYHSENSEAIFSNPNGIEFLDV